jgi:hypothetical protein
VSLCGLFLGAIRLSEPVVFFTLRSWISKNIFCQKKKKQKTKLQQDSLDSFLKSTLNVEFVYIILHAVKKNAERLASHESTSKTMINTESINFEKHSKIEHILQKT